MYTYRVLAARVFDGASFNADVDLGFEISCRVRLTLKGIYVPDQFSREKDAALQRLVFAVPDKEEEPFPLVASVVGGFNFRWASWIWLAEDFDPKEDTYEQRQMSINAKMVEQGHAEWQQGEA